MDSKFVRRGLYLLTMLGMLTIPRERALADDVSTGGQSFGAGISSVLAECNISEEEDKASAYLVPTNRGEYYDMGFADVYEDSFLYIRSKPSRDSAWVGKLYKDDAAKITGAVGEWTPVTSGKVSGYVKTEYLLVGEAAQKKAEQIIKKEKKKEDPQKAFTFAESKKEEEKRLEEETMQQEKEAQQSQKAKKSGGKAKVSGGGNGQAVAEYACQFIGNPYVWGGTDLNNGCDCSGFVQSVYKHFGVSMPRTSGEMRGAGSGVDYNSMQPGDVICYQGHVAMYIGDGKVVNAIDEAHGIGISNAAMMPIITIRRLI